MADRCGGTWQLGYPNRFFGRRLGERVLVGVQDPVTLGEQSEPQPDIAILRPRADDYRSAHPCPEDAFLVIEVSDTTHEKDREVTIPLYGRMGIPEACSWTSPATRSSASTP